MIDEFDLKEHLTKAQGQMHEDLPPVVLTYAEASMVVSAVTKLMQPLVRKFLLTETINGLLGSSPVDDEMVETITMLSEIGLSLIGKMNQMIKEVDDGDIHSANAGEPSTD